MPHCETRPAERHGSMSAKYPHGHRPYVTTASRWCGRRPGADKREASGGVGWARPLSHDGGSGTPPTPLASDRRPGPSEKSGSGQVGVCGWLAVGYHYLQDAIGGTPEPVTAPHRA
nr:hypothetical protein CFP56_79625 [Quercus suber]